MDSKNYRTPQPSASSSSSPNSTVQLVSINKNSKAPLRTLEKNMEAVQNKNLNNLIGKPENFTGDRRDEKALLWIRQIQRIKKGMNVIHTRRSVLHCDGVSTYDRTRYKEGIG